MNNLREQFAALAHEQWSGWMKYMFEQSLEREDGCIEIPSSLVNRWKRQMNTTYIELPEDEKESDRVEADKVLHVIQSNSSSNSHS